MMMALKPIILEKQKNHSGVFSINSNISLGDLDNHLSKIKSHFEEAFPDDDILELEQYIECVETRRRSNEEIKIDTLEKIVIKYWVSLNLKAINEMLNTINNRKTRGSEFTKIINVLEETRRDINYIKSKLNIFELKITYEVTLYDCRSSMMEKIEKEENDDARYKKGRRDGFIFGILSSLIAGIIISIIQIIKLG